MSSPCIKIAYPIKYIYVINLETPRIILAFYFQSRKVEVYRELFEFSAAHGARKGRELVPPGYRIFARTAGECKTKKENVKRFYIKVDLNSESVRFNFRYRDTSVGRHSLKS